MQEALKNPHYKKIWEKVIMNRHPEAESLNLALGSEYLQYEEECITITDIIIKEILGRPITLEDILSLLENQISAMTSWDEVEDRLRRLNLQCRTVTNKATKYTYNSYTQAYIRQEHGKKVCENVLFVGLIIEIQRFWQLTKPLHEQTPETWEKIANLI